MAPFVIADLVLDDGIVGLDAVFGLVVVAVAGLRAAAAVPVAAAPNRLGDSLTKLGANEVRFKAADFFSSTELVDGTDLCAETKDVGAAVPLATFLTAEPAGGRAGGLLKPPLVVRVVDVGVVFAPEVAVTTPGRRAAIGALFGGTVSFLATAGDPSLSVSVSTPDICSPVSASEGVSITASSWENTWSSSTSAILFE